jgi:hypothetical protein
MRSKEDRLRQYVLVAVVLFVIIFVVGVFGFHYIVRQDWASAVYCTATFGLNTETIIKTTDQKLFTSFFTIFAGLLFVAIATHLIDDIMHILAHEPNEP